MKNTKPYSIRILNIIISKISKINCLILISFLVLPFQQIEAQKKQNTVATDTLISPDETNLAVFKFRSIGPAMISGRVIDLAINPNNHSEYFVAIASGGVWKTTDGGINFNPVFDSQRPYSIGCVAYAQSNTHTVWIGSGENNSQRAVAYGDGVYRSVDGGKSWKNMGLKSSEHIGRILIHPKNENIVYVAAQGPLWNAGGDRGLYKSINGGVTWEKILNISENTGITEVLMDPRNPDILYAASYQRRRHVFTLIDGGPESAIYKSIDAGNTWQKLKSGLPSPEMGRIGMALSPANPDILYAIIEAADNQSGFYRSIDRGESWQKMSSYISTSPQYYNEIIADPNDENLVYSVDTYSRYSKDGGSTWKILSNAARHVDDHALWIDPSNTKHLLIGGDGGLYESFNQGQTWAYKPNLPTVQFYRVTVDNDYPFYNVYGGTQDNNSVYGPSRTYSRSGIVNADWKITNGGDGFETAIDPVDQNTIYVQSQYGWLNRYNRKTRETIDIRPSEPDNGEAYRWNWNAPLLVSSYDHKTLYFAANKIFKSIDQGNSWAVISPDLTQQINRNMLPVMGKIQTPDAIAKNASTSVYGNLVSLAESPIKKGLLYAGSDDGQISISEDDGGNWRTIKTIVGVPENTYISCITASQLNENIVFVSFDNHKNGDYKPYIFISKDKGKTWTSIASNLPKDETIYSIAHDHQMAELIFVGTEFGLYFTVDEGKSWKKLKSGLPSVAIYDIDIQRRENDLALATFGRGFYILDDYSALRTLKETIAKNQPAFLPIKDAWLYNPSDELGGKKGHFGDNFYTAENPPIATVIRYYYPEDFKGLKSIRIENEKSSLNYTHPTYEELQREDEEIEPYLLFIIKDSQGNEIRKLRAPVKKGINEIQWDMRHTGTYPTGLSGEMPNFGNEGNGAPALPGQYSIEMFLVSTEGIKSLNAKQLFQIKNLWNPQTGHNFVDHDFYLKTAELIRKYYGLKKEIEFLQNKINLNLVALKATPGTNPQEIIMAFKVKRQLDSLQIIISGNQSRMKRNADYTPSLDDRLSKITWGIWNSSEGPTLTHKNDYEIIYKRGKEISNFVEKLKINEIAHLDSVLDKVNAPYTPGRSNGF
jgi:photosystem II stability/assembly factor-like uncharacterized protein